MRHFALHVTGSVGREAQHCAQLRRRVHVPAACLLAQLPPPARNRCNGGGAGSACRSPAAGRRRRPAVASTAAAAGGSAAIPPTLEDWIRSSGGVVEGVQLATTLYPSGAVDRQLTATATVPAGSLLVEVPAALQLRYDRLPAGDAPYLERLFALMPRGSDTGAPAWQFKQALVLLHHVAKGPASPLAPYLPHLPGVAAGVPTPRVGMLMAPDAVSELQYAPLEQDIANQRYWWHQVARELLPHLAGGSSFLDPGSSGSNRGSSASTSGSSSSSSNAAQQEQASAEASRASTSSSSPAKSLPSSSSAAALEAAELGPRLFGGMPISRSLFGWAVAVVMSRTFGLRRTGTHTMPPLIDMANHVQSGANCEIRSSPSSGSISLFSKRPIAAGEALTLTYGSHDSHNLMLSYGFALQPNPHDAFWLDVDLPTLESLVEDVGGNTRQLGQPLLRPWQLAILSKLGFGGVQGQQEGHGDAAAASPAGAGAGVADGAQAAAVGPALRVYLRKSRAAEAASHGEADTADVDGPAAAGGGSGRAASGASPVDPRLLAAVRVATLPDDWGPSLEAMSAEQLGRWPQPLASRQHDVSVLRLLAALVTAVYASLPTTIQQDRQLLAAATIDVSASAAAATLTSGPHTNGPGGLPAAAAAASASGPAPSSAGAGEGEGGRGGWLAPHGGDEVAAHARDMAAALRFRLGLKLELEGCLKDLLGRAQELDALQQVR